MDSSAREFDSSFDMCCDGEDAGHADRTFQKDKQGCIEMIAWGNMHMGMRPRHCSSSCWAVWLEVLQLMQRLDVALPRLPGVQALHCKTHCLCSYGKQATTFALLR